MTVGAGSFRYGGSPSGKRCDYGWSAIRNFSPVLGTYSWAYTKSHTSSGSPSATCTGTITAMDSGTPTKPGSGDMTVAFRIQ